MSDGPTGPHPVPFAAIVVAAGRSSRMGSDKLWADLWGRPAWRWSVDAFLATPGLLRLVVVVAPDAVDRFAGALPPNTADRALVVAGGAARADSVIAGLWALTRAGHDDDTSVLVHDAARPAVSGELIETIATAAATAPAVIPAVPIVDSLKRVRNDRVVAPVEREQVAAAQTPQASRLGTLRAAIEESHAWGRPITDDAGALAAAGTPVHVVPGDAVNRKLTEPGDLVTMRAVLARRAMPIGRVRDTARLADGARVGVGFDAHRLVPGRPMRIAGVAFPGVPVGPEGHSDGDAALHALVDALLGAAALGDVGTLFPPTDDAWAGADSRDLVRRSVAVLADARWRPVNADIAVAVARPAIASHRGEIAEGVGALLGIGPEAVSVKGTTTDGLGIVDGGGMAAWAVVAVERIA